MGFTFSHPALILPCRYFPRNSYSLNGLIIGSMIPDLEYFLRSDNSSLFSHTLFGLLFFDFPAAIFLLVIYHQFIRDTLIRNLPAFIRSRLSGFMKIKWLTYLKSHWIIVSYSVIIGALTHFLWDSFTSGGEYFVRVIPFLRIKLSIMGLEYYTYKVIKHITSILGMAALLYIFFKLPVKKMHFVNRDKYYWPLVIILYIIFIVMQITTYHNHISFNGFIKKNISAGLLAIVVASLCYWLTHKRQKQLTTTNYNNN